MYVLKLGRVTAYALENAHRQLVSSSSYYCWRNSSETYVVLRRGYAATKSYVSRFLMPREVCVCSRGRLHCSCKYYERHGYPCRHIYTITRRVECTDFDVRWWLKYGQMYGEPGQLILHHGRPLLFQYSCCSKVKMCLPVQLT